MSERGQLLELLYQAAARPPSLEGRVRFWVHLRRQAEAMERNRQSGFGFAVAPLVGRGGAEPPEEFEYTVEVLVADSGRRWRVRRPDETHSGLQIVDGISGWAQVGSGEAVARPPGGFHIEVSELLDPTWVMGCDWESLTSTTSLGREALALRVHRRSSPMGQRFGSGSTPAEADVVVDASLGFLHRVASVDGGQQYRMVEFVDLQLDPDVPEAAFSLEAAGLRIIDEKEWQRRMQPPATKRLWRALRWRIRRRRQLHQMRARAAQYRSGR